eukprot:g68977.t1
MSHVTFKKKRRRENAALRAKPVDTPTTTNIEEQEKKESVVDGGLPEDDEVVEAPPKIDQEEVISAVKLKKKQKLESVFTVSTALKKARQEEESIQSDRTAKLDTRALDAITTTVTKAERDPTKPKWYGPTKGGGENVRAYSRFDYQPDLCKDYNLTGYCGYGDACKFMHDRGDYKSGWQLEQEWELQQKKKQKKLRGEEVSDEEDYEIHSDEELPFACLICHEDFVDPVVTKCKHYFCEKCALDHYSKNSRCCICNEQTHGIFNTATRVIHHAEKLKKRKADAAEAAELHEKEKIEARS